MKNISANAYYENYEDVSGVDDVIQFFGVPEPVNMIEVSEPQSLWPADEDDYSTFRVTRLLYDTLLSPGFGDLRFTPLLAESWESNENQTEWTFLLRYNVRFANGASFDANDVVASFSAIWDAADPNHTGRTGEFAMFQRLFGNMINTQ